MIKTKEESCFVNIVFVLLLNRLWNRDGCCLCSPRESKNILKEKSLASFSHLLFVLVELSNEDVFICK